MNTRQSPLSRQITSLSVFFALALIAAVGCFGWWAASRIDDRSIARQAHSVRTGLADIIDRIPVEQNGSAIWDDAVLNLRSGNGPWIEENLTAWMSDYFGHDQVYVLDSTNEAVHAARDGAAADPDLYETVRNVVTPLATALRDAMTAASADAIDSTATVTGLGVEDIVALQDGKSAIVSLRPIVPSTDAVQQSPGSEYIHVSIRVIDQQLAEEISQKFEIDGLGYSDVDINDGNKVASPILNNDGRIIGYFSWLPDEPAYALIRDTAPALAAALAFAGLTATLLLRRLKRTSAMLEHSRAEASYLAFHDALTGVPNRALFEDRLEQALAHVRRTGSIVALHYLDLDRFKHVNDTLGHPIGDELIKAAAQRLAACVSDADTIARIGGDEFAIIQVGLNDAALALSLARTVVEVIGAPFELSGHEVRVGASVGVVVTSDLGSTGEELMRQADIALYSAKGDGRGRYHLFVDEMDENVRDQRVLEMDLRSALVNETGLGLVYQPIYDTHTSTIAGAEALVRWDHPVRGLLSPATFISLAEERGLIDQLGMWVLITACRFAASSTIPWVAVNVSPIQFRDEKYADRVFEVLEQTGLAARRLELEITEGLLLQNSPLVQSTLNRLRARGVRVALDDFGTGYSSISYLRNYGVDKLKIDQSFTAALGKDQEIQGIVRSIIELGRAMHMLVTAEGVETTEQQRILATMGCDQLQGYL
ncbi:MAG TPA: EAL domain-containing protein, partial [Devosia sp.]|nr:EAL domain-containing protein [Devosia sp.]